MKVLVASVLLLLSFSTQAAVDLLPTCKDRNGNVVSGNINQFKSIINNPRANRPQVLTAGVVTDILKEDQSGSPHQKFEIKVDSDTTMVIVSNLEFGRIPVVVGKTITVCGEFLRVGKGMIHWTHFDPHGGHADGFTIVDGKLYGDKEL